MACASTLDRNGTRDGFPPLASKGRKTLHLWHTARVARVPGEEEGMARKDFAMYILYI
jgi:hypothetical protein